MRLGLQGSTTEKWNLLEVAPSQRSLLHLGHALKKDYGMPVSFLVGDTWGAFDLTQSPANAICHFPRGPY